MELTSEAASRKTPRFRMIPVRRAEVHGKPQAMGRKADWSAP